MTPDEYTQSRAAVIAGEDPTGQLMDECRRIATVLIRTAGLPVLYSPYGRWDEEAIEEVFADWVAVRLIERGQLRAMLQRAPLLRVFQRMAETSLRQHLIDRLPPSHASNLFARVQTLLQEGEFTSRGDQWSLHEWPFNQFEGGDTEKLSYAWGLGHFDVIRYDPEARKLSPLLSTEDLERFLRGMLNGGAMTAGDLVRTLCERFGVKEPQVASLDGSVLASIELDPAHAPEVNELVGTTIAELSGRQAQVLVGKAEGKTGRQLAEELGCSTGTVSHELTRIAEITARLGTDAPEVLKKVIDDLFIGGDGEDE